MSAPEPQRILVIDDNRAIHEDFRKILGPDPSSTGAIDALESQLFETDVAPARQTYLVNSAFQGEEGLELVKRSIETGGHYPLAFVDMSMPPGWDGVQTIKKIWEVDPEIQIVICSAYSDYSWEEIREQLGFGDRLLILKKPFDTAEVSQLASALTEKWQLARRAHLNLTELHGMVEEQTHALQVVNQKLVDEIEQRKRSETRYRLAATGANDGLWDWDLDAGTIYYSPRWKAMLGQREDQIADSPDEWMSRVHGDDRPGLQAAVREYVEQRSSHLHCEHRVLHQDGQYRWMLCRGLSVSNDSGRVIRVAGSLTDITDRKLAEEQLRFEALHDPLTGLANRALLSERVTFDLARARRDPKFNFGLLHIDVDHFKVINDGLGHLIGDRLLVGIGQRLVKCARESDTVARPQTDQVARIGSDEFVILLDDLADPADTLRVAERIHAALAPPFELDGHTLFAHVSIGIATGDPRYQRAEEILRDADTALFQAKEAGRGCTRMFDPVMHERATIRFRTETELRHAILHNEIVLHYQPIMSADGHLAAFEALARWQHPTRGLIPPDRFIPVAEESGLIVPLGHQVLTLACRQLRQWQVDFPSLGDISVGVNVSSKQFGRTSLVDDITKILRDTGLQPRGLKLEITESAAMQNAEQTIDTLARLKKMGVLIDLDDFGTGYSSLSHLHRMPIDTMKIDRGFVATMEHDAMSRSIVQAVIAIAHSMNLRVIAEGVETERQAQELCEIGCDYLQGYFFCKPMSVEKTTEFLSQQAART